MFDKISLIYLLFLALTLNKKVLGVEDDAFSCPPPELLAPCICNEYGDNREKHDIECSSNKSYNISDVFAKISDSTYRKNYNSFTWTLNVFVTAIPPFVFGAINYDSLQVNAINNLEKLAIISPKAFLNEKTGRNVNTKEVRINSLVAFTLEEIMSIVCGQFETVEELALSSNMNTWPIRELKRDDFATCLHRPLKAMTFSQFSLDQIETNFLHYLTNLTSLNFNTKIEKIENYAFQRNKKVHNFSVDFGDNIPVIVEFEAFVGINSANAVIETSNPDLFTNNEAAFINYFNDEPNNMVLLTFNELYPLYCDCSYRWIHELRHKLDGRLIATNGFICKDRGEDFWDLPEDYFLVCTTSQTNKSIMFLSAGVVFGILFMVICICYLFFRRQLKQYLRNCYRMDSKPRGICLIINNVNFAPHSRLSSRRGSNVDECNLIDVFQNLLHFKVEVENDKTVDEIVAIINKIRYRECLKDHDAFVCVILSHGSSGDLIYGVDGYSISVHNVTKMFNDENCTHLRNKPKMFFVNACRGDYNVESLDRGRNCSFQRRPRTLSGDSYEAIIEKDDASVNFNPADANIKTALSERCESNGPSWQDMIIVYSSVNEYASLRNVNEGSWFVTCLCKKLKEFHKMHLDNILKRVTEDMKKMSTIDTTTGRQIFAVPVIEKRAFTKYLYFNP